MVAGFEAPGELGNVGLFGSCSSSLFVCLFACSFAMQRVPRQLSTSPLWRWTLTFCSSTLQQRPVLLQNVNAKQCYHCEDPMAHEMSDCHQDSLSFSSLAAAPAVNLTIMLFSNVVSCDFLSSLRKGRRFCQSEHVDFAFEPTETPSDKNEQPPEGLG